jgi:DNA-3-methyladenine glycosylase II
MTSAEGLREAPLVFDIRPAAPFRLDLTVWALRRRPHNMIDRWDGRAFRRVVTLDGRPVELMVEQVAPPSRPRVRVTTDGARDTPASRDAIVAILDRALGLRRSLSRFYDLARRDRRLAVLAARFRGVKPPRFPSMFEALVNGVACQQLSLVVGLELLNRLSRGYGVAVPQVMGTAHAFPDAPALAAATPDDLRRLGFSGHKARAIIGLAEAVADGRIDLERLADLDDDDASERLRDLYGVGRWTAEYVLLRGLGRLNLFPGDDVGARNALARWLHRRTPLDYDGVRRALMPWSGWGGLVYFHLLLDGLARGRALATARLASPPGSRHGSPPLHGRARRHGPEVAGSL